jgi:Tol biopolymer transport system component
VTSYPIDKYLTYRLIEPGYILWNKMGIYQRNLENFSENPIMINSLSDGNCMNCHTACWNNSSTLMFHMRGEHGGTVIYKDKTLSKINTKTDKTISPGVYPSWHPSGNYIAFSVNNIVQNFHSIPSKRVEVYDTLSDIIVYDIRKNLVATCKGLSDPDMLETFPAWSPDGRELYFCSARKLPMNQNEQIRYDLFRIAFDPDNFSFGSTDTVVSVSGKGKSISFPRISPDGRYLLFCLSDFGNFSIWHPESDLWLLDLTSGKVSKPDINSNKSESFHTWSSSGRWIVFSSRREDGLYTRPYFSYFDSSGTAHKPFILPQKDPGFYLNFMKSYNLPELVTSHIDLNPGKLRGIINRVPINAKFKEE